MPGPSTPSFAGKMVALGSIACGVVLVASFAALPGVSASADGAECYFIHGAGRSDPGPPTPTFEQYWGKVIEHTPQCATRPVR